MMETFQSIGVDWRDRRMIKNLYTEQSAYVRVWNLEDRGMCDWKRCTYQGCTRCKQWVKVGGFNVKSVRFADDKAIVVMSESGLQKLMDNINRVTKDYGMKKT